MGKSRNLNNTFIVRSRYTAPAPENGVNGGQFPRVVDNATGKRVFQPLAVVIPYENGTVPALPSGFLGTVHRTPAIPGDQRLALLTHSITVFHGGSVWLRCVHEHGSAAGSTLSPDVIELELPIGLIILESGLSGVGVGLVGFTNVTDVSGLPGGGSVSSGYTRFRLIKPSKAAWGVYNSLKLQLAVTEPSLTDRTFSAARVRCFSSTASATAMGRSPPGQVRSDNWQVLAITVKRLVPVPSPPKRLHTAYCWSNPWTFPTTENTTTADATAQASQSTRHGLNSLRMWRDLGFNVIPGAGGVGESHNPSLGGGGDDHMAGMKRGIASSPFRYGDIHGAPGCIIALTMSNVSIASRTSGTVAIPNVGIFNLSARGLSEAEAEVEAVQWRAALDFHNRTGIMDMSYGGWFFRNDLTTVESYVNLTQPDYVTWDVEQFPTFESWAALANTSANFAARKLPGETDSTAVLRIARAWFGGAVAAAQRGRPSVKPYLYNVKAAFDLGIDSTAHAISNHHFDRFVSKHSNCDRLLRLCRYDLADGEQRWTGGFAVLRWLSNAERSGNAGMEHEKGTPRDRTRDRVDPLANEWCNCRDRWSADGPAGGRDVQHADPDVLQRRNRVQYVH